jgi:hypothetical protein
LRTPVGNSKGSLAGVDGITTNHAELFAQVFEVLHSQ